MTTTTRLATALEAGPGEPGPLDRPIPPEAGPRTGPEPACTCTETSVLRRRGLPIPAQHSCEYVKVRNVIVGEELHRVDDMRKGRDESPADFERRKYLAFLHHVNARVLAERP